MTYNPQRFKKLEAEISSMAQKLTPTLSDHKAREVLIDVLSHLLKNAYPGTEVQAHGSFPTRLYSLKNAINIYATIASDETPGQIVWGVSELLQYRKFSAGIPAVNKNILEFSTASGGVDIVLTIGTRKSPPREDDIWDYLTDFATECHYIAPLFVLLKHMLCAGDTDAHLPSTVLFTLLVAYSRREAGSNDTPTELAHHLIDFSLWISVKFQSTMNRIRIDGDGHDVPKGATQLGFHTPLAVENPQNPDQNLAAKIKKCNWEGSRRRFAFIYWTLVLSLNGVPPPTPFTFSRLVSAKASIHETVYALTRPDYSDFEFQRHLADLFDRNLLGAIQARDDVDSDGTPLIDSVPASILHSTETASSSSPSSSSSSSLSLFLSLSSSSSFSAPSSNLSPASSPLRSASYSSIPASSHSSPIPSASSSASSSASILSAISHPSPLPLPAPQTAPPVKIQGKRSKTGLDLSNEEVSEA